MIVEKVLQHPCGVLTQAQRLQYFRDGYLVIEDYVPQAWLERLRAATDDLLNESRNVTETDKTFILEDGHSAESPRLHRVSSPQDRHATMWDFMRDPVMTDLVADVVGPDVKFHHAKLNIKSGQGSRGFDWHQDIPAWPHTDYSPVTVGVYINGCRPDQGPLSFLPGTHNGPLHSMYDDEGNFVVRIREAELAWVTEDLVKRPTGGPGTTVLLNCRTIHGSSPNRSADPRLLLLPVYSSADSFPYTPSPIGSIHQGDVVRGKAARFASIDARNCEMPPDWRTGYKTVWQHKKPSQPAETPAM